MKIGRVGAWVVSLCALGGFVEAASPKPVSMIERTTTSQSRGAYGFRSTKYNKASWGNRWDQTIGRPAVIMSPYARKL
jgi:hypothetical protein